MATSIAITITPTRALTVEGRLVAGETAEVTITGATPTALYLVAPDQTVVAACEAFTPTGEGSGGTGFLQLATEQIAALFAHTPAGRMVAVWALVNNADGVAGAGWIPVVSAPMPAELVDLDIDFYLRASQVGAGLAIVDGKLVCTVNPAPVQSVNGKTGAVVLGAHDVGALSMSEAVAGYTDWAVDPPTYGGHALEIYHDPVLGKYMLADAVTGGVLDATADGSYPTDDATSLSFAIDTGYTATRTRLRPTEAQEATWNAKQEALTSAQLANIAAVPSKADAADLRYAAGETITASAQLADRTGNRVVPLATNTENIVLTFPNAISGHLRDFLVLVTNTTGNTGNITFTPPTGAVVYGDGFTNSPASGETWLYSVTEVAANTFWAKSVKMEVAS